MIDYVSHQACEDIKQTINALFFFSASLFPFCAFDKTIDPVAIIIIVVLVVVFINWIIHVQTNRVGPPLVRANTKSIS